MADCKIVFTGPVGAGKTTAIASLSDIPPIGTDEQATDMTRERKPRTTVAMDYGLMKIDANERLHLYGTPGQERFDFMWDILTEGGIGLVLMLDNSRKYPQQDVDFFVTAFRDYIAKTQMVVGVTRMDIHPAPGVSFYHRCLAAHGLNPAVFEVDARRRTDVATLVKALLHSLDPGLRP